MNFKLTHPLPEKCLVAVSGGVDSLAALHWLSQVEDRVQGIVHVHHNTGAFADESQELVLEKAKSLKVGIFIRQFEREPEPGHSPENWWREQRYRFFHEISAVQGNLPVVIAHNLDDCLEEYIMCTMVRGFSGTIPYRHGPCIRPFRLWKRADIQDYAQKNKILWVEDPTNLDHTRFTRAKIRKLVAPRVRYLNPGVYNIVERVIREQDKLSSTDPVTA